VMLLGEPWTWLPTLNSIAGSSVSRSRQRTGGAAQVDRFGASWFLPSRIS
jgi:hypothetical protein